MISARYAVSRYEIRLNLHQQKNAGLNLSVQSSRIKKTADSLTHLETILMKICLKTENMIRNEASAATKKQKADICTHIRVRTPP